MTRDKRQEDLQDSAGDARQEINSQKAAGAQDFFDTTSEKIEAETVEEDVKRHRRGMQKLKREQLPYFSLQQSLSRKRQMSTDIDVAINKQNALEDEGCDQNNDQPGGSPGRVVRVPHVEAIT